VSGELATAGEEERRRGGGERRRGRGGDGGHFKPARGGGRRSVGWCHVAGEGQGRGSEREGVLADWRMAPGRQRLETGGHRRRGAAMPRVRPNRGGGRGLTGGLRPQCQAAVPADRLFKQDLNHILNSKVSNKFKL
jgi:hypothetical protein